MITDTTIIANGMAFDKAVDYINSDGSLRQIIGIHINLTSGTPLTENIKNCNRLVHDGVFTRYLISNKSKLCPLNKNEKEAVAEEIEEQIKRCKSVDIVLTHADSHQHVHNNPQILPIFLNVCKKQGILRIRIFKNITNRGVVRNLYYKICNCFIRSQGFRCVDIFGNISEFCSVIKNAKNIEIMVHPDFAKDGVLINRMVADGSGIVKGENLRDEIERVKCLFEADLISYSNI